MSTRAPQATLKTPRIDTIHRRGASAVPYIDSNCFFPSAKRRNVVKLSRLQWFASVRSAPFPRRRPHG